MFGTKVDLNSLIIIYQTASNLLSSAYLILYGKASSFQIKDVNET